MKNILVVNVNWVGDVVLSSPVFKALKQAYPKVRLTALGVPRIQEILESIEGVDEVVVYDEDRKHRSLFSKLKLIRELKKRKFDAAFLLHGSLTRALIVFLAGIPIRVGYDTKQRGIFLTHKAPPLKKDIHRCNHYLNVIENFGIKINDRATRLIVFESAQKEVDEILESHDVRQEDELIVINPCGNWDLKRWPKKNFTLLIERLLSSQRVKVIIPGALRDKNFIEEIIKPLAVKPILLVGMLNLRQLIALIKRANLLISADSGPIHLASSVGTKVIALFGPTRPEITAPRGSGETLLLQYDVGCNREPCYHLKCNDNICMQSISVGDVLEAIRHK